MAPKLELRDVVVRRGRRTVLELASLEVETGEVLAVVGPNGAGKSTLLQVAALLLKPQSGEVRFDGVTARGDSLNIRRRTAVALQDAMLIEGSVIDNVALGLKLRAVPKREREARAREWLRAFGIEALEARPASKLSGGEAQRASLARAFVLEPEVLFLDEPFGGLDQPTRQSLLDDLAVAVRRTGVTTVFVTHDRDEALHLADRVAVMLGGRLRQIGNPQEVFGAPADEEVAAFLGVENVLNGTMTGESDGLAFIDVQGRRLVAVARPGLKQDVRVCLRPENIVLQNVSEGGTQGSARNLLSGVVRDVRVRGAEARVTIDCGFPLIALVTRRSVEDMSLEAGTPVAASFKATAVHLLLA